MNVYRYSKHPAVREMSERISKIRKLKLSAKKRDSVSSNANRILCDSCKNPVTATFNNIWIPPVLPDRVWMHTKIETREKDKTKREGEMKKCVLDFCHLYENYLTDWLNDSRNAHLCHFAFILVPPPKKISARTIIIYNLSIMLENVTWILLVLYFLCENGIVTQVTLHP